ncbi:MULTISPECIES: VOC family protein [Actinomadura]|uniref:VOC family protein n=1 Tax=Actinomadura yumaensis TaxID=111807 RepID=A0ABW2CSS9_9ACTN|nr:VOC family protein [Actinomadura sp. J1-007]MWK34094.1 VOC family protein [Actinomadura sp. J1-007]
MNTDTRRIPDRYGYAAIAHVMVDGADAAISFYARAFGAQELFRIAGPDGSIMHAEISIGGSVIMVGDAEAPFQSPARAGGTTVALHVFVEDVDVLYARALDAGAESLQAPADMFYGARQVMIRDPFGHVWAFLTQREDVPPEEIARRGNELLGSAG